jgi:ABC-2 type transport system permease protein
MSTVSRVTEMPRNLRPLLAVAHTQGLMTANMRIAQFGLIANPIFFFLVGTLGVSRDSDLGLRAAALGAGLTTLWSGIVFTTMLDLERDRRMGMIRPLLVAPLGLPLTLMIRALANGVFATVPLTILIVIATAHDNWSTLQVAAIRSVVLINLVAGFSAFALITSSVMLVYQAVRSFVNYINLPMILLMGLLVPLDRLPRYFQVAGKLFPLSFLVASVQAAFGVPLGSMPPPAGQLFAGTAIACGLLVLAYLLARMIEVRAIHAAGIELD